MKTHTLCYAGIILLGAGSLYVGLSGWVVAEFESRIEQQLREKPQRTEPPTAPAKPAPVVAGDGKDDAKAKAAVQADETTPSKEGVKSKNNVRTETVGPSESRVIYQGVSFTNIASARQFAEESKINRYFRWVYRVPPGLPILLTAIAFGVMGGIANIVHKLAGSEPVNPLMMIFKPLFGGVVGLMVFGLATAMPKLIVESAEGVRPLTLIFLCLFAGTFSNHVYAWVEEKTKFIFPLGAGTGTSQSTPVPPAKFPPPQP